MKLIRVLLVSTLLPLSLLLVAVARPTTRTTTTRATTAKQRTRGIIPHKSSKLAAKTTFLSTSSSAAAVVDWKQELLQRAKVGFYFGLWYALNIVYNIVNKKLLNVWPAPLTVGTLQLAIGALYAWTAWTTGLRQRPTTTPSALRYVGVWHAAGHLATTVSLGAGTVSFTQIVKAMEPFFSSAVAAVVSQQVMPWPVYATLLPVVGGVGYACLQERSFSWFAFGTAMMANVSFALRAVWSKKAMTIANNNESSSVPLLTPTNAYALITMAGLVASLPVVVVGEGRTLWPLLQQALHQQSAVSLARAVVLSGLYLRLCNEVMFLALSAVHPITLAVGNTMKRVFVILASVIVFGNVVTTQVAVGSGIGIGGVLLYSLTKQYYEKRSKETEALPNVGRVSKKKR